MRKTIFGAALLCAAALSSTTAALTAHAADLKPVEIQVQTAQDRYGVGDTVQFNVALTNHNEYTLNDLTVSASLPEGFDVTANASYSVQLAPNETKMYSVSAVMNSPIDSGEPAPAAGENSPLLPLVCTVTAAGAVMVVLSRSRKARRTLSFLLALGITASAAVYQEGFRSFAADLTAHVAQRYSFSYGAERYALTLNGVYEKDENIIGVDAEITDTMGSYGCCYFDEAVPELNGTLLNSGYVTKLSYELRDAKDTLLKSGDLDVAPEWTIGDFGLVVGANKLSVTAEDADGTVYTDNLILCNSCEENMLPLGITLNDTDGDKLIDYYEDWLSLNPNSDDTDGDGLKDIDELFSYGTDPTKADTDDNGITDPDDDMDADGLSLRDELKYGTDLTQKDSDYDGMTDGDEVHVYHTDPMKPDTDGDGIDDGKEPAAGFDPALTDTDGNGISDGEEVSEQTTETKLESETKPAITAASVRINVPGVISDHVTITNTEDSDKLSAGVVGAVGSPVAITCDVPFESADIIFTYDESKLNGTKPEDLAIMWYDEAEQLYRIFDQDTVLDPVNHTVTYHTTHFSTYLVVDRMIWLDTWREPVNYREGQEQNHTDYDIALIVDVSGSMSGSYLTRAKTALNSFVDAMYSNDYASLVSFDSTAKLWQAPTSFKGLLRNAIGMLSAGGGTNTDAGLSLGLTQLTGSGRADTKKIAVMICDGDVNYQQSTIDIAKANDIAVYTINVVNGDNALLQQIADETGGEYYYAATSDEINAKINNIRQNTIGFIPPQDSDGDGLPDIFETTGVRIQNGSMFQTSPVYADMDGDGLLDSQEVGGVPFPVPMMLMGQEYSCVLCRAASDPHTNDSDGDSILDADDLNPFTAARHYKEYTKGSTIDYDFLNNNIIPSLQHLIDRTAARHGNYDYGFAEDAKIVASYSTASIMGNAALTLGGISMTCAEALLHFLDNFGTTVYWNELFMINYRATAQGKKNYDEQFNNVVEFAKDVMKDHTTLTLISSVPFTAYENDLGLDWTIVSDVNWLATLGGCSGLMAAEIARNGDKYTVSTKYTLYDYYDWEFTKEEDDRCFIWPLYNYMMGRMNAVGIAKDFLQYGTYSNLWYTVT